MALRAFTQQNTKVYFIRPLKPDLFKTPDQYKKDVIFRTVGATVYHIKGNKQSDSLFIVANDFSVWKDSIAFSLSIPNALMSEGRIRINPIYYPNKQNHKGDLPSYILGNEQTLNRIKLKIKSDPSGAIVYLIPKIYWEQQKRLSQYNADALAPYLVSAGTTTVYTYVQEYVYIAVFAYKKKYSAIQFAPNHLSPIDSIYAKIK
jgi:hypothetical protein